MPSLESLDNLLTQAAKLLDVAAAEIRDVPLEPKKENIRRIAAALTEIFEVQQRIYALNPEFQPRFLSEPSKNPEANRALGLAILEAYRLNDEGQPDAGVAVLESYQAGEDSAYHREVAQSLIDHLRDRGRP